MTTTTVACCNDSWFHIQRQPEECCLNPLFEAILSYMDARDDFDVVHRDYEDFSDETLARVLETLDASHRYVERLRTHVCTPTHARAQGIE